MTVAVTLTIPAEFIVGEGGPRGCSLGPRDDIADWIDHTMPDRVSFNIEFYSFTTDGEIIWRTCPSTIEFEREGDAALFRLRWL